MDSLAEPTSSVSAPRWLKLLGPLDWEHFSSWGGALSDWLVPRLEEGGLQRLETLGEQDLCWDDPDWLDKVLAPVVLYDVEEIISELGDALDRVTLRTYHGCRVADAGVFHREGLKVNDPAACADEVRRIVAEEEALAWMRSDLDAKLAAWDARERDTGKVYVCIDERVQLEYAGHYALYGSEWVLSFFTFAERRVLRSRGVPTFVELDIPLSWTSPSTRDGLARSLLQEWTRQIVNRPDWLPARDFTIILRHDIPPEHVVGHTHPAVLKCPYELKREYRSEATVCPGCAPSNAP